MANRFLLKHRDLKVEYNVGANPSFAAFTYTHTDDAPASFTPAEVTTTTTPLGELVTVPLQKSVDIGGEMFGFFLPDIQLTMGEQEEFVTTGIYARYSGPDSFPQRPESWHAIELHGVAEEAAQPL